MQNITEIRPKFRHNAVFIQTEDGLFVTGEGVSFQLKGKSIARWVSVLRRSMNGQYTLEQLCARLAPAQREHMIRIVTQLLERGIVKDSLPEASETLTLAVSTRFREQVDYIDYFVDYPQQHFKQFRESSLLLYGSGESLKALALFLVRNGIQQLSIATPDAVDEYKAALEPDVDALRQAGCEITLTLMPGQSHENFATFTDYDVIVYCSDQSSFQTISSLNQRSVAENRVFLSATLFSDQILLGPLVQPSEGPCWFCALMRLSANSDDRTQALLWQTLKFGNMTTPQDTISSLPLARRIGFGLGFELFKARTGCLPSETENGVIFQNLDDLESTRSELIQHPCCPVCNAVSPQVLISQLESVVNRSRDYKGTDIELYEKHQHLFDQRLGLFKQYADDDKEQLPLKRSRIVGGKLGPLVSTKLDVTAFSIDTPFTARLGALKLAIGAYIQENFSYSSLVFTNWRTLIEQGKTVIRPQDISIWSGSLSLQTHTNIAWHPAFSLQTKSLVYVPAAAVYSSTSLNNQRMFQKTLAGAAVDTTFEKVLTQGLLSALGNEYLHQALHAPFVVRQIDLNTLQEQDEQDADLHFLVQSVARFTGTVEIKEVLMDSPLAFVLAYASGTVPPGGKAVGFARTKIEAIKAALLDLISIFQGGDALNPIDDSQAELIENMLGWHVLAPTDLPYKEPSGENTNTSLIQDFLERTGRDVLFVHTTSQDIWDENAFISGKVLLTRPGLRLA